MSQPHSSSKRNRFVQFWYVDANYAETTAQIRTNLRLEFTAWRYGSSQLPNTPCKTQAMQTVCRKLTKKLHFCLRIGPSCQLQWLPRLPPPQCVVDCACRMGRDAIFCFLIPNVLDHILEWPLHCNEAGQVVSGIAELINYPSAMQSPRLSYSNTVARTNLPLRGANQPKFKRSGQTRWWDRTASKLASNPKWNAKGTTPRSAKRMPARRARASASTLCGRMSEFEMMAQSFLLS